MFKIVDNSQSGRVVQTFDNRSTALAAADRMNAGWWPQLRFVVLPMREGDEKRADHVYDAHSKA